MTKTQLEQQIYNWLDFEADKLREMQSLMQTIKNPEDYERNNVKFSQIESAIADTRTAHAKRMELEDSLLHGEYEDETDNIYGISAYVGTGF